MSQQNTTHEHEDTGARRERFPKPRTFPTKWADSEGYSGEGETSQGTSGTLAMGGQADPLNMDGETGTQAASDKPMESFPQPRTFPKRWRLTGSE